MIAIVLIGVIEIVGVGAALLSERPAPRSAQGLTFDVPKRSSTWIIGSLTSRAERTSITLTKDKSP
jgi:hypothetical protein